MVERELQIVNALGLHARAAAQLVRLAQTFESSITLYRDDTGIEADAGSILNVLYIAAGCGARIRIRAEGTDEKAAMDAVVNLFEKGFGEETPPVVSE
jgi:phosphocarrier protein HPr